MHRKVPLLLAIIALFLSLPSLCWPLASNNVPLDSSLYSYLEKLAGFGLISSDIRGIRPYAKSEVARLVLEAEDGLEELDGDGRVFAATLIKRVKELVPREVDLSRHPDRAPLFDYNPMSSARLRYVYLDGVPRDYNRDVQDPAHQQAFGFIGGDLRPFDGGIVHTSGTEGTPLFENNEGVVYRQGGNIDLRWSVEGDVGSRVSLLLEPRLLITPGNSTIDLQKGYVKIGSGGVELEIGRDTNWFGPGFRGNTVLTSNARNFDLVKLSSPEPLDVPLLRNYQGDVKYSLILSRFDASGTSPDRRRPWFIGAKLAIKPADWWEIGGNFARQMEKGGNRNQILGGGENDHSNTLAGFDLRFRIPSLRNTEVYLEYSGEDNAGGVWPIVESYVAGFHIPRLTASGKDDLRFEYFWGSVMLYGDWQFPSGYVYHDMTPGHSQGTAATDFFVRYSHWFSVRNSIALEYFHTERGRVGRLPGQAIEYKNAWRGFWSLPLYGNWDVNLMGGGEQINNFNLVSGVHMTNVIGKMDISYRY
jgi:hypothetical protein